MLLVLGTLGDRGEFLGLPRPFTLKANRGLFAGLSGFGLSGSSRSETTGSSDSRRDSGGDGPGCSTPNVTVFFFDCGDFGLTLGSPRSSGGGLDVVRLNAPGLCVAPKSVGGTLVLWA
jgi:hypothetical protein